MPRTKDQAEREAPAQAQSFILQPRQMASRFVKGQTGNPNLFGMSNRDAAQGRINAKTALRIRATLLETLESQIATQQLVVVNPEATAEERNEAIQKILKFISSDVNTMLRDAETRGLGAPKQEISLKTEDKSLEEMTDAELEEILLTAEDADYTMIEAPREYDDDH